jgi:tetratricopeptide (TPR) repeat protein
MLREAVMAPALAAASALMLAAQEPRLGSADFPATCSEAALRHFRHGVLYLHSFEYADAAGAFRRARQTDSSCAMAVWGEAMSFNHPIWNEQNLEAGREALARLGRSREERLARAPTSRERMYLESVEVLYGGGGKQRRDTLYALAMERLAAAYPQDLEAKAFLALAILGLSQGVRSVPAYMRAAAIAEEVFRANPDHPGAAHYIIHAFDDPVHAPLGLPAARAYSRIAPDAAHAQHMTTHIFLAVGMWDEVVSQNEIAADLTAWVPGHYTEWLHYGLLQQGRYREAAALLERVRANASAERPRQARSLAFMRLQQRVATAELDELAGVLQGDSPRLGGDPAAARKSAALALQLRALSIRRGRRAEEAVAALREAAAIEDALPLEFGPPDLVKPSHELLGELLLDLGRPEPAQRAFERALELTPGRSRALAGLVRAASAAGDRDAARRAFAVLERNWRRADPEHGELDRLRPLLATR